MAVKLYVGGIPYSSTDTDVRDVFAQVGEVESVQIVTDRATGRSRGFGFVTMKEDADADRAIEMWNGKDFQGRKLTVNVARPMAPREGFRGGFRGQAE
ncbi:RNA-binding protein [Patescibacteria group bacterium]|nr:MAG: RNA-binding protein [Patescibacteria group bacterium]